MKIRECNIHCPSDPKNKGTYMLRHRYQTRASTATEHCAPLRHSPILHLHACPFFPLPPISTPIPSPPPLADQVSLTLVISFPPSSPAVAASAALGVPPPRQGGDLHVVRIRGEGSGWERRVAGCDTPTAHTLAGTLPMNPATASPSLPGASSLRTAVTQPPPQPSGLALFPLTHQHSHPIPTHLADPDHAGLDEHTPPPPPRSLRSAASGAPPPRQGGDLRL